MIQRKQLINFFLLILILLSGCSVKHETEGFQVELAVTKDFCSEILFKNRINVQPGETVLDILEKNMEVETSSGGFVNAIKGVKSDIRNSPSKDWFFYINGVASNCSAKAYRLQSGDKIIWDFHAWNEGSFIPSIVGSYPEPFIHGFRNNTKGTKIYYVQDCKNQAEKMKQSLAELGAKNISESLLPENFKTEPGFPVLIIGEYYQLMKNKSIEQLLSDTAEEGMYVKFNREGTALLDYSGSVKKQYGSSTGVLFTVGEFLGDTAPVWILTSSEHKEIKDFADFIYNNPQKIKEFYGAVYANGKVERLPVQK